MDDASPVLRCCYTNEGPVPRALGSRRVTQLRVKLSQKMLHSTSLDRALIFFLLQMDGQRDRQAQVPCLASL